MSRIIFQLFILYIIHARLATAELQEDTIEQSVASVYFANIKVLLSVASVHHMCHILVRVIIYGPFVNMMLLP